MNIGIATLHRARNFGAFLQAFGLQSFLDDQGVHAAVLDYNSAPSSYRRLRRTASQLLKNGTFSLRQARVFDNAAREHLRIMPADARPELLVVGSDEVWNLRNPTFRSLPQFFGRDLPGGRVVSYAPSMGQSTREDLAARPDLVDGLKSFWRLSGRDANTVDSVSQLTGRSVERVVDPTFLIDWGERARSVPAEDALVVYSYALTKDQIDMARGIARDRGWRIITPGLAHPWADERLVCDPFEFIGLLRDAPAVLTDTFHGTIFSALTGARFGILGPVRKNKLSTLVDELRLQDRVVSSPKEMLAAFEQRAHVDWSLQGYGRRVADSKAYLIACLDACRDPVAAGELASVP